MSKPTRSSLDQRPGKRRRQRLLWIGFILLAIAIGPFLVRRAMAPSYRVQLFSAKNPADRTVSDSISIVTYNIAHGRGPIDDNWQGTTDSKQKRIESISSLLREINADVVVLNEVDFDSTWSGGQNQAAAIAKTAGYSWRVEQRNLDFGFIYGSWTFGNTILSKFPITNAATVRYPPLKIWESWLAGSKQGVVCTITPPGRTPFRVAAVHLEHRDESIRADSAERLIQLASESPLPLIAAGDFNSSLTGFPFSETTADGKNAMDSLRKSGKFQLRPDTELESEQVTFSVPAPDRVIDWILVPPESDIESYDVIDTELSDHFPVRAVIQLPIAE